MRHNGPVVIFPVSEQLFPQPGGCLDRRQRMRPDRPIDLYSQDALVVRPSIAVEILSAPIEKTTGILEA